MARSAFQTSVLAGTETVSVQPNASVEIRSASTNQLPQVWSARQGGVQLGNPFQADAEGFALGFVEAGIYNITLTNGTEIRTLERYIIADERSASGVLAEQVDAIIEQGGVGYFADTAEGLAATTDGEFFIVIVDDDPVVATQLYLNDDGTAVLQVEFPGAQALQSALDAAASAEQSAMDAAFEASRAEQEADRAESEADRAEGAANSVNLPIISPADAGKPIIVNAAGDGYVVVDVVDLLYPVGAAYTQYPGMAAPASLYGGTWELRFDDEGVFFRTEGGEASAFGSGVQEDAIQSHFHYSGVCSYENISNQLENARFGYREFGASNQRSAGGGGIIASGVGAAATSDVATLAVDKPGVSDDAPQSALLGNRTIARRALETRSRNRTIRVWERTA